VVSDEVERWARARGYWNEHNGADVLLMAEWSMHMDGARVEISTSRHAARGHVVELWCLDPLTALLWAACVESGVMVDMGPCPACGGNPPWYGTGASMKQRCDRCEQAGRIRKPLALLVCEGACQTCSGTGVEQAATHVQTRPKGKGWRSRGRVPFGQPRWEHDCPNCEGGSVMPREHVLVAADRLQDQDEPLGTWLAAWLAAWLRGKCQTCEGYSSVCDCPLAYQGYGCVDCMNTGHLVAEPCPTCAGHGVYLGEHGDAMAAYIMNIIADRAAQRFTLSNLRGAALSVLGVEECQADDSTTDESVPPCTVRVRYTGPADPDEVTLAVRASMPLGTALYVVHGGELFSGGFLGETRSVFRRGPQW
jgi:hypothetical protein